MTWIQKQTSFRCSLARSFPHKLELLSILISEISDERIGKQEKGKVEIINAYQGEEAKEIYQKLVFPKSKKTSFSKEKTT